MGTIKGRSSTFSFPEPIVCLSRRRRRLRKTMGSGDENRSFSCFASTLPSLHKSGIDTFLFAYILYEHFLNQCYCFWKIFLPLPLPDFVTIKPCVKPSMIWFFFRKKPLFFIWMTKKTIYIFLSKMHQNIVHPVQNLGKGFFLPYLPDASWGWGYKPSGLNTLLVIGLSTDICLPLEPFSFSNTNVEKIVE